MLKPAVNKRRVLRLRLYHEVSIVFLFLCAACAAWAGGPWFATGVKVGEVTDTQAILWARLTRAAERVGVEGGLPKVLYRNARTGELEESEQGRRDRAPVVEYPAGGSVETLEGAVPVAAGSVRVVYKADSSTDWTTMEWAPVDAAKDYARQIKLTGLTPATLYEYRVQSRGPGMAEPAGLITGSFRTAPAADTEAKVTFAVTTCHEYAHLDAFGSGRAGARPHLGFKIYPVMLALKPDFYVHTGDIVYYDKLAKTQALARWHWQRIYSLPNAVEFHRFVPSYFMKDDHDTWMNDCFPGMKTRYMGEFTFEQGQAIFLEQVPIEPPAYRTFRWGKDVQVWLVEGRDYRSPNDIPDGPEKTIWGAEQKAWFKRTVDESDAAFRVLISPTPLVGPDRRNKNDNHSNKGFTHEGDELRQFLASRKNMVVLHGDRHWQYFSIDDETGLHEYSCGAASDEHAGGWDKEDFLPEHQYMRVVGGFLLVKVERRDGEPVMTLQHRDVDGEILNEDVFSGK